MSSLQSQDPTVAVLIERLNRHMADFEEFRKENREELRDLRQEMKADVAAVRAEVTTTKNSVGGIEEILKKGKFLWIVVASVGAAGLWALGLVEKVLRIWW